LSANPAWSAPIAILIQGAFHNDGVAVSGCGVSLRKSP